MHVWILIKRIVRKGLTALPGGKVGPYGMTHEHFFPQPFNAAHWMMFSCPTSLESWRTSAPSRVLRRTLTWRSLQKCWKLIYLGLSK